MLASSETTLSLPAGVDLHARPAGVFVKTAMRFAARVTVSLDGRDADAKSILAVLALGAKAGSVLHLRADGDDAAPALAALSHCLDAVA
jgi:phosphocarrier protein HPr